MAKFYFINLKNTTEKCKIEFDSPKNLMISGTVKKNHILINPQDAYVHDF